MQVRFITSRPTGKPGCKLYCCKRKCHSWFMNLVGNSVVILPCLEWETRHLCPSRRVYELSLCCRKWYNFTSKSDCEKTFPCVVIITSPWPNSWQYELAKKKQKNSEVLNLAPSHNGLGLLGLPWITRRSLINANHGIQKPVDREGDSLGSGWARCTRCRGIGKLRSIVIRW